MPQESCTGGVTGHRNPPGTPKTVDYSPRKWPKRLEITSFDDASRVVYRGSQGIEILQGPEIRGLVHKNGQKCFLMMPLESCIGGHGLSKSSRDPKTVDYSPRKRLEMLESRVLMLPVESCTGGHGASKSCRDPKTVDYSPQKRPKMPKITSFDDAAKVVYRGSRGIEILPGHENRGLAHEKCQKCSNHEF